VHDRLFTLPDETLVYPAHHYPGRRVSSIGQAKTRNPRLGVGKTLSEFVALVAKLGCHAPSPSITPSPAISGCVMCPQDFPEHLQEYRARMGDSPQG